MKRKLQRSIARAALAPALFLGALGLAAHAEEAAAPGLTLAPTATSEAPATPALAKDEKFPVDFNTTADVVSRYVWRGILQNPDACVQPSATATWQGLSLNVWGNYATSDWGANRENNFSEVDYTGSYNYVFKDLPAVNSLSLTGGFIWYAFPNNPVCNNTKEFFATVALPDLWLTPAVSAYYDVDEADGWYLNAGVGHTFNLIEKVSLNLGASVGWNDGNESQFYYGVDQSGFADLGLGTTLNYNITETLVASVYYKYSYILDNDLREAANGWQSGDQSVFGARLSYSF